jgi:hypothetical protein
MKKFLLLIVVFLVSCTFNSTSSGTVRKQVQYKYYPKMLPIASHDASILRHPTKKMILIKDIIEIPRSEIPQQPYAIFIISNEMYLQDIFIDGYAAYFEKIDDIKVLENEKLLTTNQLNLIQTSGSIIKLYLPQWEDLTVLSKVTMRYVWSIRKDTQHNNLTRNSFQLLGEKFFLPTSFRGDNKATISVETNKDFRVLRNGVDGSARDLEYTKMTSFDIAKYTEAVIITGNKR